MDINIDLEKLIDALPYSIREKLVKHPTKHELIEIILDLGRRPEARFKHNSEYLSQKRISWQEIGYVTKRISIVSDKNRAGIDRTLHRISCIRNRQYLIHGLTCRVGRAIFGTIAIIRDLLELDKSLLILGKPGVGKTTIVREIARILADELHKRVIIIDTSNEIAGDSDVPHFGIGGARRLQVVKTELQHQVMIEAVENHMPQVIVIDEIGTELEALAARTITEKGVQLIGTTHGDCLNNLIKNPSLTDLIGGIQHVTLSDEEAKRRKTQKSILERKAYPAFEIIVEITTSTTWTIHENVENAVNFYLRNNYTVAQVRQSFSVEKTKIKCRRVQNYFAFSRQNPPVAASFQYPITKTWGDANKIKKIRTKSNSKSLVIYPYSIPKNLLREALCRSGIKFTLSRNLHEVDIIIGLKKHLQKNLKLKILSRRKGIPIYTVNQISFYQIVKLIKFLSTSEFNSLA